MSRMSWKENNNGELVICIPGIFIICIVYNKYGLIERNQYDTNIEIYNNIWISDLFCNNTNAVIGRPIIINQ